MDLLPQVIRNCLFRTTASRMSSKNHVFHVDYHEKAILLDSYLPDQSVPDNLISAVYVDLQSKLSFIYAFSISLDSLASGV